MGWKRSKIEKEKLRRMFKNNQRGVYFDARKGRLVRYYERGLIKYYKKLSNRQVRRASKKDLFRNKSSDYQKFAANALDYYW